MSGCSLRIRNWIFSLEVSYLGNSEIYGSLRSAHSIVGCGGGLMKRAASSTIQRNRTNAPEKAA